MAITKHVQNISHDDFEQATVLKLCWYDFKAALKKDPMLSKLPDKRYRNHKKHEFQAKYKVF